MSGSYSSRLRAGGGGGGLGATTVLAAKVAFASAALAAAACVVPQLVSGADAFLWKLYLFVTVHVIIFVIWKLSDSKHFHAAQHKDPWAPSPIHHPAAAAVPPLLTEEVVLAPVRRKVEFAPAPAVVSAAPAEVFRVPTPVSRRYEVADSAVVEEVVSPGSCGGESCVTTESEEDSSSAVASAYIATAETNSGVSPGRAPARERAVLERGISLPPPPTAAPTAEHFHGAEDDHEDVADDDDLDATWNLIMQKTRPATAPAATTTTSPPAPRSSPPPPTPTPRPRAREPSVGAAELSKRSEDFIKKIHNSFGRHQ